MCSQKKSLVAVYLLIFIVSSSLPGLARSQNGWDYFFLNRYDKAIESFQQELNRKESVESLYGLALSYLRYGQLTAKFYQQALLLESHYYRLLLALKGDNIKYSNYTLYYLGGVQFRLGEYENAIGNLSRVLENPEVGLRYKGYAKLVIGECYLRQGKIQKAEELWKDVEKMIASDVLLGSELAVVYTEHGIKTSEMLRRCDEYSRLDAPSEQTNKFWHNLGWIYYRNGRVQEALDYFSRVDIATPEMEDNVHEEKMVRFYSPIYFKHSSEVYFAASALVLEKLREHDKVRLRTQRIDKLRTQALGKKYKDNVSYSLGLCYLETAKIDSAIDVLRELQDDPYARVLLARAYYQSGQISDAESEWDRIESNSANAPGVLIELAYTYARLGIRQDRVKGLLKLVTPDGENDGIGSSEPVETLNLKNVSFPPYGAIPRSEKYRRMGIAYLNIRKIYEDIGKIDRKINTTLEYGHNKMGKNIVGNWRRGNDPLLLVDLAFSFYSKGYNSYPEPTEIYLVMQQQYYPEVKQLHNAMQGIFALWPYVSDEERDKLKCEHYSVSFG